MICPPRLAPTTPRCSTVSRPRVMCRWNWSLARMRASLSWSPRRRMLEARVVLENLVETLDRLAFAAPDGSPETDEKPVICHASLLLSIKRPCRIWRIPYQHHLPRIRLRSLRVLSRRVASGSYLGSLRPKRLVCYKCSLSLSALLSIRLSDVTSRVQAPASPIVQCRRPYQMYRRIRRIMTARAHAGGQPNRESWSLPSRARRSWLIMEVTGDGEAACASDP
jgi:hypothetical protein